MASDANGAEEYSARAHYATEPSAPMLGRAGRVLETIPSTTGLLQVARGPGSSTATHVASDEPAVQHANVGNASLGYDTVPSRRSIAGFSANTVAADSMNNVSIDPLLGASQGGLANEQPNVAMEREANMGEGQQKSSGVIRTGKQSRVRDGGVVDGKSKERPSKVKIALAPDQPTTTQGKPRERVYVACLQCRSRKIRCDGDKPKCYNCQHRGMEQCVYDALPKRRGPDKFPGTRQRSAQNDRDVDGDVADDIPKRRRRKTTDTSASDTSPVEPSGSALNGPESPSDVPKLSDPPFEAAHVVVRTQLFDPPPLNTQNNFDQFSLQHNGFRKAHDPYTGLALPPVSGSTTNHPYPNGFPQNYRHGFQESLSHANVAVPSQVDARTWASAQHPVANHPPSSIGEGGFNILPGETAAPINEVYPSHLGSSDHSQSLHIQIPSLTHSGVPHLANLSHASVSPVDLYPLASATSEVPNYNTHGQATLGSQLSAARTSQAHLRYSEPGFAPARPHQPSGDYDNVSRLNDSPVIHPPAFVPSQTANADQRTGNYFPGLSQAGLSSSSVVPRGSSYTTTNVSDHVPYGYGQGYTGQHDLRYASDSALRLQEVEAEQEDEDRTQVATIASTPSLEFIRKTWWDHLLEFYSSPRYPQRNHTFTQPLSSDARTRASQLITADLQFLIRASNFWFSFINVPLFFTTFCDPNLRDRSMQPALVLAMLTMSFYLRSSEAEEGRAGRMRARWLRDRAHAALQASVSAQWVDPGLAQAAWLLTLYEVSSHPDQSPATTASAFGMLDSIIHALNLTYMDREDPGVQSFSLDATSSKQPSPRVPAGSIPTFPPNEPGAVGSSNPPPSWDPQRVVSKDACGSPVSPGVKGCSCMSLTLGQNWPQAAQHTPFWLFTAAWNPDWSMAEIRQEECRRLCWSVLSLTAGYTTYKAAMGMAHSDMFILQPSSYRLLFPGESLRSSSLWKDKVLQSEDTVWSLYARAMLLWHSCLRMRNQDVSDHERADWAKSVWIEADAIDMALNEHTCCLEKAMIYQGREHLFNARIFVSYEFRRYIPYPHTGVANMFHRGKAQEWLNHQAVLAKRVVGAYNMLTGLQKNNVLSQRPFFGSWFMSQISRCLQLWTFDYTLTFALEVAKLYLSPIEYLTTLWPCTDQRTKYADLRARLDQACLQAGLPPPPKSTVIGSGAH